MDLFPLGMGEIETNIKLSEALTYSATSFLERRNHIEAL